MEKRPFIGIGVYIFNDKDEMLIGKRKSAHGIGKWSPPGGHLEFGESFEDCAKRETMEEAGINIKNVSIWGITNDFHENENKHYVTIHLKAQLKSGVPSLMEPDKWETWEWRKLDNLPSDSELFLPVVNFLKTCHLDRTK